MGLITPESRDMFHGPKERWVDTLTTLYTDFEMNTFVFWHLRRGRRPRRARSTGQRLMVSLASAAGKRKIA